MGSLLEWFSTKREEKVIKRTKEHSKKVYECVYEFQRAIELYCDGKVDKAAKLISRVNQIENEADDIRREVLLLLSKGQMVPQVREDLTHLTKRLDDVANGANAAGRRLQLLATEQGSIFISQI